MREDQVWWLKSIIPATWVVEIEGVSVQDLPVHKS
jgi:hypothetical protein